VISVTGRCAAPHEPYPAMGGRRRLRSFVPHGPFDFAQAGLDGAHPHSVQVPISATLVFQPIPMIKSTAGPAHQAAHKEILSSTTSRVLAMLLLFATVCAAQQVTPDLFKAMQWRLIGPFRGGRITSVCGVPSQPNVYYAGTPGGGVWKTVDAGQVWKPIFDRAQVASIGAVAVSLSNPNIVYVGTGEQTRGSGVYKSLDAGQTWTNMGLRDTHMISGTIVDPYNPDIVLVSSAGDYENGGERGVYRSADGGKSWQRVLFKDEHSGAVDLESAPDDPKILYAVFWTRPEDPFEPREEKVKTQDAAMYKSTDEGLTWTPIEGKGLPAEAMGRMGVAVAPGTNGKRVFAVVSQGFFRSEDGGANWQRSSTDPRVIGNGYFSRVFVDPRNAQNVYVAQTSMYRSTDGGHTFEAWQGAPSGDDYHNIWINPNDDRLMIIGVDQGAGVSVDGGLTWSSWYNQPTGQFYHVSTDQQFPYNVFGAQQDSGTAGVASRSDYGEITYRDWAPVGGFEFSFIVPDPLNSNFIYTGGWYGTVLRYDKTTGQITHLLIRTQKYRTANMAPIAFSPQDPHILYAAAQYLLKTADGGVSWQEASPDLTVKGDPNRKPDRRRDNITTISLSRVKQNVIWAGTGNGLVHVTEDGKNWQNVTMTGLPDKASITVVESSPFDATSAYVVVNATHNTRPMVYRTRDFGKTWQPITTGLPDDWTVRVVRADPIRRGLLYAGTTTGIFFSLDDGDHWQSLQLSLPTCTVTDIDVHGDDLVISTFGRSLWILDDITPIRELDANWLGASAYLLPPEPAVRTRWDMYQDTPLPLETPAGKNPPDGAIIDYFLKSAPAGEITLSIYDSKHNLVREFSSVPEPVDPTPANVPSYWFAPPTALTKNAGLNRFAWNLRYPAPKPLRYGYFGEHLDYIEYTLADDAIPGETPREQPNGPYIVPGTYTLVLKVDGQSYTQPLTVTLDPRVHVSQADLTRQLDVAQNISAQMSVTFEVYDHVTSLRSAVAERVKTVAGQSTLQPVADALKSLDEHIAKLETGTPPDLGFGPMNRELARLESMVETSDSGPAELLVSAVRQSCQDLSKRLADWSQLNANEIAHANTLLQQNGLQSLLVKSQVPRAPECD